MADQLIGFAVRGIASGIGLASESIHHHKEKKRAAKAAINGDSNHDSSTSSPNLSSSTSNSKDQSDRVLEEEDDDAHWALDEAQEEVTIPEPVQENLRERDISKIMQAFVNKHPLTQEQLMSITTLPLPVILPQKRPKDRSRGFIRAYAPILEGSAIDQPTFIDFLSTFERSTQASPWIQTINLAGIAGFFIPELCSLALTAAIMITIKTASNIQNRTRGNEFLDQANSEFFRPRGLYCLVMTWNPDSDETEERLDINNTITTSLAATNASKISKASHRMRRSDGKTSEHAIPQAAPLIFPGLDELADQSGEEAAKKQNKVKKSAAFAADYFDKRASAKYAAKHPDSVLVQGPKPKFSSRYADPAHPASNGNLISLLSGGRVNPPPGMIGGGRGSVGFGGGFRGGFGRGFGGRAGWGGVGYNDRANVRYDRLYGGRGFGYGGWQNNFGQGTLPIGPLGLGALGQQGIKKLLKKNVMYLMVVNMPSEEEMTAANDMFEMGC